MVKFGKQVVKHRVAILIASILLLIPSVFGYFHTRVNYDVLTYLPKDIETMQGQDIMLEDFDIGAFSMFMVDGMEDKDVAALKSKIEQVDHVKNVLWYDSIADISVPKSMLPKDIYEVFNSDKGTMMAIFFDDTTSADETLDAVKEIRHISGKQCFLSGMSTVVEDTKELSEKETPIYVLIAVLLSTLVLAVTMESAFVPILFLFSIGMAIVYNLGSNIFLGEISYVTKALSAVLQLGVTMDYSIFLMHSYQEQQVRYDGDKKRAMAHAISQTFSSVVGSSITTVAGFIALCFMSFTLGKDIGIVMAKGVIFGVIACVTILPSMILCCDKWIEKTKHKPLLPDIGRISDKVTKKYGWYVAIFLILMVPAIYGNSHVDVYYNLDATLPKELPSIIANEKLKDDYDMNTTHMLLVDRSLSAKDTGEMLKKIEEVDGVKWALGLDKLVGPGVPKSMIPDSVTEMLQSDQYQMILINSTYKVASDKVNRQVGEINKILDRYDKGAMLVGEAPLTKDLINITDKDFKTVSAVSIGIIFLIIFAVYVLMMVFQAMRARNNQEVVQLETMENEELTIMSYPMSLLCIVGGAAAIAFGGDLTVDAASRIAIDFGMSQNLVGLTIVSIGTSLPELVTSIVAARKNEVDMAVGNAIGSNIFNILMVLGIASAISPLQLIGENVIDIIVLVVFSVVVWIFGATKKEISRTEGIAMICMYLCYSAYIIMR